MPFDLYLVAESFFFLIFIFTLFYFTILYWFCHTLTWICHGCTWVPNPEPLSHLPHHIISLDHPHAPAPSILYPALNIDWWFVSYMVVNLSLIFSLCCCSGSQLCLTLCDPRDWSTPGFPVLCHLLELDQTHVPWVSDAIQPCHLLYLPSAPALNLSQHQDLFWWVNSSH